MSPSGPLHFFRSLPLFTRVVSVLTIVFLVYGYLCRWIPVYFFWESKTLGWVLLMVTIITLLVHRLKTRDRTRRKETFPEKLGIGLAAFILLIQGVAFFFLPRSSAYDSALKFIHTHWYVQSNVGKVRSVVVVPYGSLSTTSSQDGEAGQADLHFIIKGERKYMDLNLVMEKEVDTEWNIEINE